MVDKQSDLAYWDTRRPQLNGRPTYMRVPAVLPTFTLRPKGPTTGIWELVVNVPTDTSGNRFHQLYREIDLTRRGENFIEMLMNYEAAPEFMLHSIFGMMPPLTAAARTSKLTLVSRQTPTAPTDEPSAPIDQSAEDLGF